MNPTLPIKDQATPFRVPRRSGRYVKNETLTMRDGASIYSVDFLYYDGIDKAFVLLDGVVKRVYKFQLSR